jgi:hypothetical protein
MTEKVTFDIEAMLPWQKDLVTGVRKGEMTIMMGGRQTGKSYYAAYARMFNDIMNSNLKVSDIVLGEGTVYGSRYYTAEPIGGNWLEMESWCVTTFGEGSRAIWGEKKAPEPARRWYANNRKFWFRSEKDRDWFIVMWRA